MRLPSYVPFLYQLFNLSELLGMEQGIGGGDRSEID